MGKQLEIIYMTISTSTSFCTSVGIGISVVVGVPPCLLGSQQTNITFGWKMLETIKPQNNYIFLIPLNIPDFAASIVFLIRVRLPGGAAIIFPQSWNFELKFIVDNPFMQKINSTGMGSHSLPK